MKFTLNCKGKLLVADQPLVMGIINSTSDSFYEGSRFPAHETALKEAEKMLHEGADIIDIGGQSSRPGAKQVGVDVELDRVIPAIEKVHQQFPDAIISIDTYHAHVALEAISAGASIVNDISAGNLDRGMIPAIGKMDVPYICMHMKGDPQTMQQFASYENIHSELLDYFIAKKNECIGAGIKDLIIDPGFGFAKTMEQNFVLLNKLEVFSILGCPMLVGLSRKSTIYKTLGVNAEQALNGTTVLNTIALMKGASILRVHDVKEAKEAVLLVSATQMQLGK